MAEAVEDINNNSDDEAVKCAICLDDVTNRAQPSSCVHNFCYECIREWSQVKPECPLCKIRFRIIRHNFRSETDYDDFVVPPPPTRIPVHLGHIIQDFLPDLPDDFDDELLEVPMIFNTEGHYSFLYQGTRGPPRQPARADFFLNRLLDSGPQPLHVHLPSPHAYRSPRTQYSNLQTSPLTASHHQYTTPFDVAPYAHSSVSDVHSSLVNRAPASHYHGADFRRSVYEHNQWVRERPGTIFPSPEYFRSDPTVIARITPWLQREVYALLSGNHAESPSLVSLVLNDILSLVYRFDIRSREFRHCVSRHIGTRTSHFQHEFYNFVLSGMRIEEYDYHVNYTVQQPRPPNLLHLSPPIPIFHVNMPYAPSPVRPVGLGHGSNVALQEHNYATPSPTATNRRAINNDHDYMNTRSPNMTTSRSMEFGRREVPHVPARETLSVRSGSYRDGTQEDRIRRTSNGVRSACCTAPRVPGHLRSASIGDTVLSNQNHSCRTRDNCVSNPSHHRPRWNRLSPNVGHTSVNQATTSQSRPDSPSPVPATEEDLFNVMYTTASPISYRCVGPYAPPPFRLGQSDVRQRVQPVTPEPCPYPRPFYMRPHHSTDHRVHPTIVDYPLSPTNVERPTPAQPECSLNIDFPPSPPLLNLRPERPLTLEDFPILAVRCNANEREQESRNSVRRPDMQPRQESLFEGSQRRCLHNSGHDSSSARLSVPQIGNCTRTLFHGSGEREMEQSVRPQNPSFGVRIEVFPTGITEAPVIPYSIYTHGQPLYTTVDFPPSNSASCLVRDRVSTNDLHLHSRTTSPAEAVRHSSDDDDCQVVAVQPVSKRPPLDVITLSSDDDSLDDFPFSRWEKRNDEREADSVTSNTENEVVEKSRLDNSGTAEEANLPGPSSKFFRIWSRPMKQGPNLSPSSSAIVLQPRSSSQQTNLSDSTAKISSLLEDYRAKKMRFENSVSSFTTNDSPLKKNSRIKLLPTEDSTSSTKKSSGHGKQDVWQFDDSDDNSSPDDDDVASSTTAAAAAALVGLRYGNPTVKEDDANNELMRRSSVIRHTNIPTTSMLSVSKGSLVENYNRGGKSRCFGKSGNQVPESSSNYCPADSDTDEKDSDVEVIVSNSGDSKELLRNSSDPDVTFATGTASRDQSRYPNQWNTSDDDGDENDAEVEDLFEPTAENGNDEVVITSVSLNTPDDCGIFQSLYFRGRNS